MAIITAVVVLTSCGVNYSLIGIGLDHTPTGDNSLRSQPLQLRFEASLSCVGFGFLGWDEDIHLNVALFLGVRADGPRQSRSAEGVIDDHQVAHSETPFLLRRSAVPGPLPAVTGALPRRYGQTTWSEPSGPPAEPVQRFERWRSFSKLLMPTGRVGQGRRSRPEGKP